MTNDDEPYVPDAITPMTNENGSTHSRSGARHIWNSLPPYLFFLWYDDDDIYIIYEYIYMYSCAPVFFFCVFFCSS